MRFKAKQPKKQKPREPRAPRYSIDEVVCRARVDKILGRMPYPGQTGRMDFCWQYRLMCLVCGESFDLSQVRLRERERRQKHICVACEKLAKARERRRIRGADASKAVRSCADVMAMWPVPPLLRARRDA